MKRSGAFYLLAGLLLCAMLIFVLPAFVADHDCAGEHCAVCACVQLCQSLLRVFAGAALAALVGLQPTRQRATGCAVCAAKCRAYTPVALKVKLTI